MVRKWFQLVDKDGNALTSATSVAVDIEDVDTLRKAAFAEVSRALPATVIAADLTVYENRLTFDTKEAFPTSWSSVKEYGNDGANALIVQVKERLVKDSDYIILPHVQEQVKNAVFVIVEEDEDHNGVGMGVFFSPTLAVTCDHNLMDEHTVGSVVSLALKDGMANVEVVFRDSELDFAILKSSNPRSFIPPWSGNPDQLTARRLVLASFRLGISDFDVTKNVLGFSETHGICVSPHQRHITYSCETYPGDSGAALLIKDGFLVGIHLETVNALREEFERKKLIEERLNDVEESLDNIVRSGLAQGCTGLLVHQFKDVVKEQFHSK